MAELKVQSRSVADTHRWARRLARIVQPGDVLALKGDLGAGKTTFTQAFADELGVEAVVNSPTFTLIKEYHGRLMLYHMDLYRLEDEADIQAMGLDEYFYGDGVCVIEWPERLGPELPDDAITLEIGHVSADERSIRIVGRHGRGRERIKELATA